MAKKRKNNKGFLAITTVLVIMSVVMILGISAFYTGIMEQNISGAYDKKADATMLAEACLREGFSILKDDLSFYGYDRLEIEKDEVKVGGQVCDELKVEDVNPYTKRVSAMALAGEENPHYEQVEGEFRYVQESTNAEWGDYEEIDTVDIGDPAIVGRETAFNDEWEDAHTREDVDTEGHELVLGSVVAEGDVVARTEETSSDWEDYYEAEDIDTQGDDLVLGEEEVEFSREWHHTSNRSEGEIQEWTVPETKNYRITAYGAQGGDYGDGEDGGLGAKVSGEFVLEEGQQLDILVGHQGEALEDNRSPAGGGGGGSFVIEKDGTDREDIYVIAGGGGGGNVDTPGDPGVVEEDGTDGENNPDSGGEGGGGGLAGDGNYPGAGGGGFFGDGSGDTFAEGGEAFVNGATGGDGWAEGEGGFGGGGGTDYGAGGGGGYSGGGGGNDYQDAGGGGGSYNTGEDQENEEGVNEYHGKVEIVSAETAYVPEGYRVSQPLPLDDIKSAERSLIEWEESEEGGHISIHTAITEDPTATPEEWNEAISGSYITGIREGDDLSGKYLWVKQDLSTPDDSVTPELHSLTVEVEDQESYEYKENGTRISQPFSLDEIEEVETSLIEWRDTIQGGTYLDVYTAVTELSTSPPQEEEWEEATNDASIPEIGVGEDLSGKYLWVKQELSTEDATITPRLHNLTIRVTQPGEGDFLALREVYEEEEGEQMTKVTDEETDWMNANLMEGLEVDDGDLVLQDDTEGERISQPMLLEEIDMLWDSSIGWSSTGTEETEVEMHTAVTEEQETPEEWKEAVDGESIPQLEVGEDYSDKYLWTRQVLSTTDPEITPRVHDLTETVSDTEIIYQRVEGHRTSSDLDISGGGVVRDSEIFWKGDTRTDDYAEVSTRVYKDGEWTNWEQVENGGTIPGLERGVELSGVVKVQNRVDFIGGPEFYPQLDEIEIFLETH